MIGNCMKSTRHILTFDPSFSTSSHGLIMKDLLEAIFDVPKSHRKTRPYIDHVVHFGWADDRIWVRTYQIKEGSAEEESIEGLSLAEMGPRFVLHPVRVMEGSFSGRTTWLNPNYTPASAVRASIRMGEAAKHRQRNSNQEASMWRKKNTVMPDNELDHVFD